MSIDDGRHQLLVSVQVVHQVDRLQVVVVETHVGQNLVAFVLDQFIVAEQFDEHFFVLGLEHPDCYRVHIGDVNLIRADLQAFRVRQHREGLPRADVLSYLVVFLTKQLV